MTAVVSHASSPVPADRSTLPSRAPPTSFEGPRVDLTRCLPHARPRFPGLGRHPAPTDFTPYAAEHVPARVTRVDRGACDALAADGPMRATFSGALLAAGAADPVATPCVGDWVAVRPWPDGRVTAEAVLPRRTAFVRASVTPGHLARPGAGRQRRRRRRRRGAAPGARPRAGSSGSSRWRGRAGPARWWCSPRPTWCPTPTGCGRTWRPLRPGVEVVRGERHDRRGDWPRSRRTSSRAGRSRSSGRPARASRR